MANISSVGISSGVLTSDLIEKLSSAEREPVELRLDRKEEEVQAKLSAIGKLRSALTDLRLPSRVLSNADSLRSLTANSSSSALTATVSGKATTGSYSVDITDLAQAHALKTNGYADKSVTTLGTGTLTFSVGGKTTNVTIDSSNNTLEGIAKAVNAQSDSGVNASVINTGSNFVLVFASKETGLDNAINITVSDGDGNNTDTSGLSQLASANLTESSAAKDAAFTINGVPITRSTNSVTDVIDGVTLNLASKTSGSAFSLTIANDDEAIVGRLNDFIEKFNSLKTLSNELTEYNSTNPSESGMFLGDATLRSINGQIRGILGQIVPGLSGSKVRSLSEVGISTDKETGLLSLDENVFKAKLTSNTDDVIGLFADQGRTTDAQVSFVSSSANTKPGSYDINITQAATNGQLTGSLALGPSITIDADNDDFKIKVDGYESGLITLSANTYTQADFLTELQAKLDADSALKGAGKSVTASFDGTGQLQFTSNSFGAVSKVEITQVDTNSLSQLGISVAAGTDGVDVVGTINGKAATGSGQTLRMDSDDDSKGISVKVEGSATGSRGKVTYIEGIAEQLVDKLNSFLSFDGSVGNKETTYNKELESIAKDREKLESRISALQSRLTQQFTAADILVGQLKSTQDFLTNQLGALLGTNKKD